MEYIYPKIEMDEKEQNRRKLIRAFLVCIGGVIIIALAIILSGRAPGKFIEGSIVTIPQKASTREVAIILNDAHIIRSKALFQFSVKMLSGGHPVIAGDFSFDQKQSVFKVARVITGGHFGKAQAKITIPEGSSTKEIAAIIEKAIPEWNGDEFLMKAKLLEGYLFPETYFMFKTITPDAVIERLQKEYEARVSPLRPEIAATKRKESQIIIMASILEREARNADEAKTISGILWKRFDKGMPLQVDAAPETYKHKGLATYPISNPGLGMITAAIHSTSSPYWYYLHDKNGVVHYAKTYEEHVQNKKKYLK